MLIFGKSKWKFSITSKFAIIIFCKTFYFINQVFFFKRDGFLWAYFFKKASDFIQEVRFFIEKQYLLSELPEVPIHRCSRTF